MILIYAQGFLFTKHVLLNKKNTDKVLNKQDKSQVVLKRHTNLYGNPLLSKH